MAHPLAKLNALAVRNYGRVTAMINGDEEIGLPDTRALIEQASWEHDAVLSFEGGGGPRTDRIRLAASDIAAAALAVRGRASHAGSTPERGVSAGYELAHQVLLAGNVSNPATGVCLNATLAGAGVVRNMIRLPRWRGLPSASTASPLDGIE